LDPVYIAEKWTDEILQVMVEKLIERKEHANAAIEGKTRGLPRSGGDTVVSDTALFSQLGAKLRVVKGE
jgi:hypothetical protein